MRQLLAFLSSQRVFILFIILEGFALSCLFFFNDYQKRIFTSWIGSQIEKIHYLTSSIRLYYYLDQFNQDLMNENITLRNQVIALQNRLTYYQTRVPYIRPLPFNKDSIYSEYRFIKAKVVKTELLGAFNYCIINRGKKDGIKSGNGVILSSGALGIVTELNDNQSIVYLFSNPKIEFTCQIGLNPIYCRYQWDREDPYSGFLYFIPSEVKVRKGDKVYTTGLDQVFPPYTLVGKIQEVYPDLNHPGYQVAKIQLHYKNQEFAYVYVVQSKYSSLEFDSTFTIFQKHLNIYSKNE